MNLLQQIKAVRISAAFVFAVLALTLTIPVHAVTPVTVFNFNFTNGDPSFPSGNLIQGRDGNLYGTSYYGGATNGGALYRMTPTGVMTIVHSFVPAEGIGCGGIVLGTDGNFYGSCTTGGADFVGTIFKMTPAGVFTTLHTCNNDGSGYYPQALMQASDGNIYGTTLQGGTNNTGTFFKITTTGTLTLLRSFNGSPANEGSYPSGPLTQATDGNFYGTTQGGGVGLNNGTVYKMTATGTMTVLYTFAVSSSPQAGVTQGTDGNFYGTTQIAGDNNQGAIFQITPGGTLTFLHSFSTATEGGFPSMPLTQGTDGAFYSSATTCYAGGCQPGSIFKITAKGVFTVLYNFPLINGNSQVVASTLLQRTSGLFYGTTQQGGANVNGLFYSYNNGLKPFVSLVSTSGKQTAKIGILGQGFSAATVVTFGGVTATYTRTGTTFLTATVPAGALTGLVNVTTGTVSVNSNRTFQVKPTVASFSPSSGPVGTSVIITGTGLTQASRVAFNNKVAIFTVNSDTQITATVPTGATTGKIAVTTKGGSVMSTTNFTVN